MSWRIWLALVLLGASYPLALWHPGVSRLTREPSGYYGELTEAFLAGQLHLKAKPDPRLEALANPYAGDQGVPRLHDHVYFNHRYYLYFGTTPVFFFFAPVRLITGFYPSDGLGSAFFGLLGFVFGAWLLLRLRPRFFPDLGEAWTVAGLAVWAFAGHAQLLTHSDAVYPVPINCAFACLTAALACCLTAWDNPGRRRWLVLVSLSWGLAIASRPNYLFSLGGLLVFLVALLIRDRQLPADCRPGLPGTLLAIGLPISLIGCGLAAYNWARFHRLTEFGTSYMLMAGDQRAMPILTWSHLPIGLHNSLLIPVDYTAYFPFAAPLGKGTLLISPILFLILALPGFWFFSPAGERPFWRLGGTVLLLTFFGNLLTVGMLLTQEYRYNVDYLPTAALLAVLLCWSLARILTRITRPWARAGRMALALIVGVTLFHAFAANMGMFNLPQRAPTLSRWLNYPTHWLETALGYRYGPLRLTGRLPLREPGTVLPLVVTGRGNDILYLRYTGPNEVQFGFFHTGAGGPEGVPFKLDLGREHTFVVDLGSLYPPTEHPLFAGRPPREVKLLRQRIHVTVDGQVVLEGASDFYPTYPGDLLIGENPRGIFTRAARFDASGLKAKRLGLPLLPPVAAYPLKPMRLELTFPPFVHFKREPLISTGHRDAGDLIYVIYVGPNQLRFAHDSWGGSSVESWIVSYEPGRVYSLEVDMGSLHPHAAGERFEGPLRIQLDGAPIMAVRRPFFASDATELAFGYNATESTATYPLFGGQIRKITPIDNLSESKQEYGAVRCAVLFPTDRPGRQEPLVVSGRTGAGDLVYVVYAGNNTIRLGYDHWNKGGPLSDPIPVDYEKTHLLEVSMGSLMPATDNDPAWKNLDAEARRSLLENVTIKLDGQVVLTHPSVTYPAKPDEVAVGSNPIGGSTCDPLFGGRFLLSERFMPVAPPPAAKP